MKRKMIMLLAVIMLLSCMPVMAQDSSVGANAVRSGWTKVGSDWKFYVNGTAVKSRVVTIKGQMFGFDGQGRLQKGFFEINNKTYFASTQFGPQNKKAIKYGIVLTGYRKIQNSFYYFNPQRKGQMVTGFVKIGTSLYYFNTTSGKQRVEKGWFFLGNAMYYVQADGTIATNTTVDGIKVGPDGAATDVYGMDRKAQGYSSSTRYLILVNKKNHYVNVYTGSKGSWVGSRKYMRCTIGKSSTPTPSGKFVLNSKNNRAYGYKDFKNSTAFYASRISAGNYFHSILYKLGSRNPYTAKIKDASLGKNKSNSCVRLGLDDAKYIYQSAPKGTCVVVY